MSQTPFTRLQYNFVHVKLGGMHQVKALHFRHVTFALKGIQPPRLSFLYFGSSEEFV